MKNQIYAMEEQYLKAYLTEKINSRETDREAALALSGPIPTPGSNEAVDAIYSREGNTAHIRIDGPLSNEGPDFWDIAFGYGGTSYPAIIGAVERANNDPSVEKITADISSPGGSVEGLFDAAASFRTSKKPVTTVGRGMVASAAYEIASQSAQILAADPTTEFGSIGVLVAGWNMDGMEEKEGVKRIVLTSSNAPNKAPKIGTEKGDAILQERIDAFERHFYASVSQGRHVSNEYIAENFGKGGLVMAQDPDPKRPTALSVGMIDGIVGQAPRSAQNPVSTPAAAGENNIPAPAGTREKTMTLAELLAADPSAKAAHDALIAQAEKNGREKAESDAKAIFAKCKVAFDNEAYAGLRDLALKVISGESKIEALEASYANADMFAEKEKSLLAQIETLKTGAVKGEAPDPKAGTPEAELRAAVADIAAKKLAAKEGK
ncbi:hypothetical protein FACS189479_04400 [Spirochaetia bacterium]|nr:hypothetical protein FACS189479_04400 [Spirochaetia bacterium]